MFREAMAALVAGCVLAACTHVEHSTTVAVAGGGHIRLTKLGESFAQAENNRYVVTESGLTTFRRSGRNFIRWQFTIRVKQPTPLADIKIEEVSGDTPVLILEDRQPRVDAVPARQLYSQSQGGHPFPDGAGNTCAAVTQDGRASLIAGRGLPPRLTS
jgi:hypothetical protein